MNARHYDAHNINEELWNNMKTNLVTRGGFEILQKELRFLWSQERPEITQKVAWAASLGDRSENADLL